MVVTKVRHFPFVNPIEPANELNRNCKPHEQYEAVDRKPKHILVQLGRGRNLLRGPALQQPKLAGYPVRQVNLDGVEAN